MGHVSHIDDFEKFFSGYGAIFWTRIEISKNPTEHLNTCEGITVYGKRERQHRHVFT